MKISNVTLFICFTFTLTLIGNGQVHPGVEITVTRHGLDLVKNLVLAKVEEKLTSKDVKVANVNGNPEITGIVLSAIKFGTTSFRTRPPNVFIASISGGRASVKAKYQYRKKIFWSTRTFRGEVTAKATRINIHQEVILNRDRSGKPVFAIGGCLARVGDIDVKFRKSGILDILYNLIGTIFESKIEKEIAKKICPALTKVLRSEAGKITRKINMHFPFVSRTMIDLSLVRNPVATSRAIIAGSKGRCYSRAFPSQTYPFSASTLPSVPTTLHMTSILIGDYVMNTLLYAVYLDGRLTKVFSQREIEDALKKTLSSSSFDTSEYPIAAGLGRNTSLQVVISANTVPMAKSNSSGITVRAPFVLTVNGIDDNDPSGTTVQILQLRLTVEVSGRISVRSDRIYANITHVDVDVIGGPRGLSLSDINDILDIYIPSIVIPALNGLASTGFEIPNHFKFKLTDVQIIHRNGALQVNANFSHA